MQKIISPFGYVTLIKEIFRTFRKAKRKTAANSLGGVSIFGGEKIPAD